MSHVLRVRFLQRRLRRGLPGVYEAVRPANAELSLACSLFWKQCRRPPAVHQVVLSGHLQSAPVHETGLRKRPEVTGADWSGHRFITRNEGVPGSSPGVGFCDLQGFSALAAVLLTGSGVYQRST